MKRCVSVLLLALALALAGCSGCSSGEGGTYYLDPGGYNYTDYEDSPGESDDEDVPGYEPPRSSCVIVPYMEHPYHLITLPVKINGMGLDMLFDTGASVTSITLAEAQYLYDKGRLSEEDILDVQLVQTADGGICEGLRIVLRSVQIGDEILLRDVEAMVVGDQRAPLLLGQSVMGQFREVSVDRTTKTVKFYR